MENTLSEETHAAAPMHRVIRFATITGAGFVLGQFSGLLREMVVSAQFGLSAELDAYFIARQVPTLINNIVAGSAIVAAVTPVFSRDLALGQRDEFWRTTSIITNWVLLITGALTILGMAFAPWVIELVAALTGVLGGRLASSTQGIASMLLIIMMPTLFLSAALNMLLAMLNSLDRFTGPALIFLALNVGIIATVILLTPLIGVYSVALGFLIGVLLQVLIQIVDLRYEQPRYTFRLDWHHPAVRQVFIAFLPITALAITAQINSLVDGWMAAALAPGSVSALSYANTMLGVFYMVGISLGIAVFPSLSRMAALNDAENTARAIVSSLRLLIFILTPITFLLIAFGSPIIGLLLGRGRFDATAVQMTAQALGAYAIGLIAIAAIYVLQRAFFAITDNATPFVIGVLTAIFHIALNFVLMRYWAHAGIALSTSITALITAGLLMIFLARKMSAIHLRNLMFFLSRCLLLSVPAVAMAFGIFSLVDVHDDALITRLLGASLAALACVIYFALALATRTEESQQVMQYALSLVRRNRE